jgi:aromatic ring hydroxylase
MKKINKSLYEDKHPETSTKGTGFKDKEKALDTLKIIKKRDLVYQKQVVNTMYNRAKYHPHQTKEMRDAMKIFKDWLDKNN